MYKNRNIWENIVWALGATPMVMIVGLIIITLIGAIDDAITIIQARGQWWLIVIVAFVVSLIYLLYEPSIRKNIEKKKTLDALVLYFREQLRIRGVEQITESGVESLKKMLLDKLNL
jgi:cbb3-type cytochrome oxidase subunit 3